MRRRPQIKQSPPNQDQILQFLASPPYLKAGEDARNTLKWSASRTEIEIAFEQSLFQERKGKAKICRKRIHQRYYECRECQLEYNMVLCEECFDFSKHKGHHYVEIQNSGECDCGIKYRWRQEGFCDNHSVLEKQEQILIREGEEGKFMNFFGDCFEIYFAFLAEHDQDSNQYFQQKMGKYLNQLLGYLSTLNLNSLFYNELTSRLLVMPLRQTKNEPLLVNLMTIDSQIHYQKLAKLILHLSEVDAVIKLFYQTCFLHFDPTDMSEKVFFSKVNDGVYEKLYIYNQLAEQGVLAFHKVKDLNVESIKQFYLGLMEGLKTREYNYEGGKLVSCWKEMKRRGFLSLENFQPEQFETVLKDCLSHPDFLQQLLQIFFDYVVKTIASFDQSQDGRKNRGNIAFAHFQRIVRVLTSFVGGNVHKIADKFCSLSRTPQNVQIILAAVLQELFNDQREINQLSLRVLGLIMKVCRNQANNGLKSMVGQLAGTTIKSINKFVVRILSAVVFNRGQYYWNLFKVSPQEQKKSLHKKCEESFKKFIYAHQQVHLETIHRLRAQQLLSFSGAGQILSTLADFDHKKNSFVWKQSEEQIKLDISFFSFENFIARSNKLPIRYGSDQNLDGFFPPQVDLQELSSIQDLLIQILNPFCQEMQKRQMSLLDEGNKISESDLLIFVNAYIICHKVLNGKTEFFQKELEKIEYAIREGKMPFLKKLFKEIPEMKSYEDGLQSLEKKEEKKQEQIKNRMGQEENLRERNKDPSIRMKMEKKVEQIRKKREQFLKKNNLEYGVQSKQDKNDICLICKQFNPEKGSLFLVSCIKKLPVLSAFFNDSLACDRIIDTCMHTIHAQCYANFIGTNSFKKCPWCQRSTNVVLPIEGCLEIQSGSEVEEEQNFWINRFIFVEIQTFKNYRMEPLCLSLLQSLVNKNGILKILLQESNQSQTSSESFLFQRFKELYEKQSTQKKKKIQITFRRMIEKCQKNPQIALGLIEEILLKAYWSQKIEEEIHSQSIIAELSGLFSKLKGELVPSEFESLVGKVSSIINHAFDSFQVDKIGEQEQKKEKMISIFRFECPKDGIQLMNTMKQCPSCSSIRGWHCLMCKKTFCYQCDMIDEHRRVIHKGVCLVLVLFSGNLMTLSGIESEDVSIYRDNFMESWDQRCKNISDFKVQEKIYASAIAKWVSPY